ncbi:TenA family transcriptional regulator [Immundisolibacter sp.]|uniref:TenA family transcriptional regulator n=2 Tax=Immundisolibacter sp. TaxID=1934948 RepID=UPI003564439B
MATAAHDIHTAYLVDVKGDWLRHLKDDVLEPLAAKALAHPVLRDIESGRLPKEKFTRMMANLCWVITGFPEYVSALAARCPKNDHMVKAALLENAYIERDHPFLLAQAVTALGGPGDAILDGPDWVSFDFDPYVHMLRMTIEGYVFHRPWIEGMAATAVGVESVVPAVFGRIGAAAIKHYGLTEDDAEWFHIHSGEVEMEHGNEGLRVLDKYVADDDLDTQAACIAAARLVSDGIGVGLFDAVGRW